MSELRLYLEGAAERSRREHEADVALAWHVASLSRAKRIPPLRVLLGGRRLTESDYLAAAEAHEDIEAEVLRG